MVKAFVFLATGFEEMEALGTVDVLRRAGIQTTTVSISDEKKVVGAHQVPVEADALLSEVALEGAAALVLPGGMPGATNLNASTALKEALPTIQGRTNRRSDLCSSIGFRWIRIVEGTQGYLLSRIRGSFDWCYRNG